MDQNKIPTAEEFIPDDIYYFVDTQFDSEACILLKDIHKIMKEFAKLHVEAALESASQISLKDNSQYLRAEEREYAIEETIKYSQNTSGILNAYPLENIK